MTNGQIMSAEFPVGTVVYNPSTFFEGTIISLDNDDATPLAKVKSNHSETTITVSLSSLQTTFIEII